MQADTVSLTRNHMAFLQFNSSASCHLETKNLQLDVLFHASQHKSAGVHNTSAQSESRWVDGKKHTEWGQSHVETKLTVMTCIYSRCLGFGIRRERVGWWSWALVRKTEERQTEETVGWMEEEEPRMWEWRHHEWDHTDMEGRWQENLDWNRSSIWTSTWSQ